MANQTVYVVYLFIELIIVFSICLYLISLIYSSLKGAPYVPTSNKLISDILLKASMQPEKIFIELGCGDGRIVRRAVREYYVKGIGVDINRLLTINSQIQAKISGLKNIIFKTNNIFDISLNTADYLYIFLMPKLIEKLKPKMEHELKSGALVISHGFEVNGWKSRLINQIPTKPFPTYYYKI